MDINSKQRAKLRGMANTLPVVLYIGKDGVTDATIKEAYDLLQARELIKCAVLANAPLDPSEASGMLCARLGATPVQTIGSRFVLYRRNDKTPRIEL